MTIYVSFISFNHFSHEADDNEKWANKIVRKECDMDKNKCTSNISLATKYECEVKAKGKFHCEVCGTDLCNDKATNTPNACGKENFDKKKSGIF